MGESFFAVDFSAEMRTRNARGAVTDVRPIHDDMFLFDRKGFVYAVRSERGVLHPGDNISRYMVSTEWKFLLQNGIKFTCERVLVDTKLGAMVVFTNMAASMRVMIGIIFHSPRAAAVAQYPARATSLTWVSPRMRDYEGKNHGVTEQDYADAADTAKRAFHAFMSAGARNQMLRSLGDATSYVIDRACLIAEFVGCRLDCRSARSSLPYLQDFHIDAYLSMITTLAVYVWESCPDRFFEMKIADQGGRLFPIIRCVPESGDVPLFVNQRFTNRALDLCDGISGNRRFPFECAMYEDEDGPHLRAGFLPAVLQSEKLGVKEPVKQLYEEEWKNIQLF